MDAEGWTKELGGPGSVRELGGVRVSAVRCPALSLTGGSAGPYHLALLLAGGLVLDQEGRSARAGRGDLVLLDGGRPFRLAFTAPRNTVVTAHLPVVPGDPGQCVARTLSGREGLGALVAGLLTGLARDTTPTGPPRNAGWAWPYSNSAVRSWTRGTRNPSLSRSSRASRRTSFSTSATAASRPTTWPPRTTSPPAICTASSSAGA